jgi:DNA primase
LERKIIEILILYGNQTEEFEDVILKANEHGEIVQITEKKEYKVYQRIYLSLQEDEVELANPLFRAIFNNLMDYFLQNESFRIESYLKQLPDEFAQEVTDILMEDERLTLHNWDSQNIFVKQKVEKVAQHTSEIIISLREYLINRLILDLIKIFPEKTESDKEELKALINDYNKLKVNLTASIGRIRSTYI